MTRLTSVLFAVLVLASVLSGCTNKLAELRISGDTYLYIPSVAVDFESETTREPETILPPEAAVVAEMTTLPDTAEESVYWVPSGKVWHTKENCKSLSRSKNVESGTAGDAIAAGKERVCAICGG